jgi:hypothetical protein
MLFEELSSFDYVQIISMTFMKWCLNEGCWIDLKCLNVCYSWDLIIYSRLLNMHINWFIVLKKA